MPFQEELVVTGTSLVSCRTTGEAAGVDFPKMKTMLILQTDPNAAAALVSAEVFTSSLSPLENVSTSLHCSCLLNPCGGCRVLPWGSFGAGTFPIAGLVSACLGLGGEQRGRQKVSGLEKGR